MCGTKERAVVGGSFLTLHKVFNNDNYNPNTYNYVAKY